MKQSILLAGFLFLFVSVQAQGPLGKWFHSVAISETVSGKKTDVMEPFYKKYPCMKSSYYIFQNDKKVVELAPNCPESVSNDFNIGGSTWNTNGSSISITFHDDASVPAVYQVQYTDKNTMIWTYTYPNATKPEAIKSLTMIFNRVSN
jgi:hypothetical protein